MKDVEPPKYKRKEADHYEVSEVALLVDALESEPLKYRLMVLLTLSCGLRAGELTGLKWDDINFKENTIKINKATQYLPMKMYLRRILKNETSERIISVPEHVMDLLSVYQTEYENKQEKHGDLWEDTNYIFTKWNGLHIHPETPGKWFSKM
ncbi:phage integrase family [Clostridium pasteurianum DSM 525 = ATCC 6013]|uniref:Integrase family protein n=1 Tax=Clostridium pasteurianum DSM 525 = ATCC 6013 TaxID=1262449 RepID=A0A0H3J9K5_CLOPA|nr:site-specific integrase [Clostridium pasteurianum]AJA50037.1 phage integrase family [Clostridium pasteurianum DSM 525 = ATCC 6013]AJA54025.1 phage integrase family [Clostridium pasteurianum DSM 525 = ATCC 6013]AOZ77163.1 hypothetical protein AQ983_19480 [Clostridium pasteurianum DSM 525 = ATCC 6013]AOZ80960.1 hypothetical protein AQ984_19475 [Clostridium pasteurianum]KRU13950.1 integrase family protein [Clostridium pasteurianum DSM 525 = ATCC 6013]